MSLVKIQSELKAPKSNFNNYGNYKYRSLDDQVEAIKPLLNKYNATLYLRDEVVETKFGLYVRAEAIFKCGEEEVVVSGCAGIELDKKGMDMSQKYGTSSSYARKYAMNGLFLIDDTKDADSNEHKKEVIKGEEEESKNANPLMTDKLMEKLVERFNNGEVNVFNMASQHYILRPQDINLIGGLQK